jgi:hypothetical protein
VENGIRWLCLADGTWECLLQVQAAADDAGDIDWDIELDSTIVRTRQHAAGTRTDPPPAPSPTDSRKESELA